MIKSTELDQRKSFSFSSFDFNSSHGLFSSDDDISQGYDASNYVMYDSDDGDGDGAYIEINLNPLPTKTTVVDKEEKETPEVELRISFSAGISSTVTTTCSLSAAETSCSTTQHAQGTTNKARLGLFVSLTRIVNAFMASSVKNLNSLRVEKANFDHESNCTEMLSNRKDRTMVTSKPNGIMNFIIKFKYRNIPSMLFSMVTPKAKREQMPARQPLLQRGSSTCNENPTNDTMKLKTRNHSDLNYQDLTRDKSTTSVAGIINLKAMRGVLDSLVRTSRYYTSARTRTSFAHKNSKSKSCPNSIKSSPMHSNNNGYDDEVRRFYLRDNSVQAAIAHCKKSFGAPVDFEFHR
ncbi:uncharacterized protein LOC107820617 [Nicotiana tabacum]|uniref:Uncharacterized protein LOC107820617 n=2 Tax=Nicotiana TaxID=4085 RepID=A0A1S4CMD7_TOBAC|nr:PREDICTED: uncharacterized protein LOC104244245 [Nicotiana sylvestris]XP_016502417.1 PREDICTED: uncharacterized protein LOC107820617 [Nicotiana tabacum]